MNINLLRPAVFADLAVGDKLRHCCGTKAAVVYKAPNFVVLRFEDNSESTFNTYQLEKHFQHQPLCWVENKPVYPGDGPLYYKYDPSWKHNEEGVITSGVRDDELHFHGGIAFPIADATWTKPQLKRVPSFQVEGQDVYPGDTVYYYGINKDEWGEPHTVEENGRVVWKRTGHVADVNLHDGGTEAFRLKPQLVIGGRLVPMPEREAPAKCTVYFIPTTRNPNNYARSSWTGAECEQRWLEHGLVHLTMEAAIAHGEALVALSKKED